VNCQGPRKKLWCLLSAGCLILMTANLFGQNSSLPPRQQMLNSKKHALASERWFLRGRKVDHPAAVLLWEAYQQKLQMREMANAHAMAVAYPRLGLSSGWTSLGPAPLASDATGAGEQDYSWVSGRATAVAIDPNDTSGNTVYAGGAYGGLWRSANAGPLCTDPATVTWNVPPGQDSRACVGSLGSSAASLLDDQPTLSVGAIAVQPQLSNPDPSKSVVLVGTGETNSSIDSYYGLGILRSADSGMTWTLIQQDASETRSFSGVGFSKIAFSTSNPNLVVAAAAGTSAGELEGLQDPVSANLGLYYSQDAGLTWNYALSLNGPSTVEAGSATSVAYNAAAGLFFAALRFHGFYTSSDGANWTRLPDQPGDGLSTSACPASPTLQTCPLYRGEIAVVPKRAGANGRGEMYAWYVDANDGDRGIWRSVDAGVTWTPMNESSITQCGDLIGGCGSENGSYNLTLAAVPDNPDPNATTGTDVYAGAVNLFKCVSVGSVSDCSGTPPNTFLNLTHVYGCPPNLGSIARVHPSQHAMDFLQINGGAQVVMYFANDGGIYRTLDGYSGLTSGDCGSPNQFDSLNQTIGSMTQFVSLAQHPTDANTLFGGAQGNGTPASAESQLGTTWINIDSGDGGYSEINPDNPAEWFTANTGVTIQRCSFGIACHASDFNNDMVVSSSTVGGDAGTLYTPFILDPQNSGEMIVGTCRVWRGATTGAGFNALSNNFETGSGSPCSGAEINMIRSLAAGGTKDSNGFSQTIYAGTDGSGPLFSTPAGGRLMVGVSAAGMNSWADRTGNINPQHFPISGIALDTSDSTGNTAYAGIMGFHTSHLWRTVNAGQAWMDFQGVSPTSLPDAPANSVLVDNGTVYVGTDVGVFASSTSAPSWSEVGATPVPNGGQTGYLPNVPVTALRMFNNGATKLLRASTYGRGVWQYALTTTPDFALAVPESVQMIFAGQPATFSGTLSAFNGFGNPVTLSCGGLAPGNCNVAPNQITPVGASSPFTLTASGISGDYAFSVQGVSGSFGRAAALILHVIDFSLSAPAPSTIPVPLNGTSAPVAMQLNFLGTFPANGVVEFSCAAATGLTCNFFPSASINASSGRSLAMTVTVSASSNVLAGSSIATITASSSAAGLKTVTQPLGISVTTSQDYSLTVASPTAVPAGQTAILQGTVTALNGYNNAVQLACIAGNTPMPESCTVTPSAVKASAGEFTVTVTNSSTGVFSFGVQGIGSDLDSITHVTPVALSYYDFQTDVDTSSASVSAGQAATYNLTFTPLGPGTFPKALSYSCTQLPALSTCIFTPSQVGPGSGITPVKLTVSTTAAIALLRKPMRFSYDLLAYAISIPLGFIWMLPAASTLRGNRRRLFVLLAILGLTLLHSACGGGLTGGGSGGGPTPEPGTPLGSYPFTVTVTEGSGTQMAQHSVPLTLTVH
jgi:hypothetical protein